MKFSELKVGEWFKTPYSSRLQKIENVWSGECGENHLNLKPVNCISDTGKFCEIRQNQEVTKINCVQAFDIKFELPDFTVTELDINPDTEEPYTEAYIDGFMCAKSGGDKKENQHDPSGFGWDGGKTHYQWNCGFEDYTFKKEKYIRDILESGNNI